MEMQKQKAEIDTDARLLSVHARTRDKKDLAKPWNTFFEQAIAGKEMVTDAQAQNLLSVFRFLIGETWGGVAVTKEQARTALEAMSNFDYSRKDNGLLQANPSLTASWTQMAKELAEFVRQDLNETEQRDVQTLEIRCYILSGNHSLARPLMQKSTDMNLWKMFLETQSNPTLNDAEENRLAFEAMEAQTGGKYMTQDMISLFKESFIKAGHVDDGHSPKPVPRMDYKEGDGFNLEPAVRLHEAAIRSNSDIIFSGIQQELPVHPYTGAVPSHYDVESVPGLKGVVDLTLVYDFTLSPVRETHTLEARLHTFRKRFNYEPDVQTINLLVRRAYDNNNVGLARSMLKHAEQAGIELTGSTYLPEMEYAVRQGHIKAAVAVWDNILYSYEPLGLHDMTQAMEMLIRGICKMDTVDSELATAFGELIQNHGKYARRFAPETVAALLPYYFQTDELLEASLLMRKHIPHFSMAARASIHSVIMDMCSHITRAALQEMEYEHEEKVWSLYTFLKGLFPEVHREHYERLMLLFLSVGNETRALQIFNDMCAHWELSQRPSEDTYCIALIGFKTPQSIRAVHNQLKIDYRLDPTRRLRLALLNGYSRIEDRVKSLELWEDIQKDGESMTEGTAVAGLQMSRLQSDEGVTTQEVWKYVAERMRPTQDMLNEFAYAVMAELDMETYQTLVESVADGLDAELAMETAQQLLALEMENTEVEP